MSGQSIFEAGDLKELENMCINVQELDLSNNELSDWNEVNKSLIFI